MEVKTKGAQVVSVVLRGRRNFLFFCSCYMWYFLSGLIHIGEKSFPAGRMGEKPSIGLTESLKNLGHSMGRLKTGTPPRLLASSINRSLTKPSPEMTSLSLFQFIQKDLFW